MKTYFYYALFAFIAWFFVPVKAFCSSAAPIPNVYENEAEIRLWLNGLISTLESGKRLSATQERCLFSDFSLEGGWEFFWALNYKDRQVQCLKMLIERSQYSKEKKGLFSPIVSREARSHRFGEICRDGLDFPVVFSRDDWDQKFFVPPLPVEKQKEAFRSLAEAHREYVVALESEKGAVFEYVRPYFQKAASLHVSVLALTPPFQKKEEEKLAEDFFKNNLPLIARAMQLESKYFHSGVDIYELCGISLEDIIFADSYLVDYALLKEREEVLRRRQEREKRKVTAP